MKKIGIVVVTYNRIEWLKKCLKAIEKLNIPEKYVAVTYVIDNNSTDGTKQYLKNKSNIRYIELNENTGGSGGFYTGIKTSIEDGMDYVWGMDDDAIPNVDSLKMLLCEVEKNGDENCYWSNCNQDSEFLDGNLKYVDTWMFVGFFLSKLIIQNVGFPRKDFFIYHDDSEYAYRIIKSGYKIIKVKNSIIKHRDGISDYFTGKRFLGKAINNYSNLSDWKRYYDVRNTLLMYSKFDYNFWKALFIYCPKIVISALLYNPKQIKLIIIAIMHGIFGIAGIYIKP